MFFLNKKIPYKYAIYSGHSNGIWEYIHDLHAGGICNRCLELSQLSSTRKFILKIVYVHMCLTAMLFTIEVIFHVYDGFVFPHDNWWSKINKYLLDTGINTRESHGYSLVVFLKTVCSNILEFDVSRAFDISRIIDTVCNLYFHLKQKKYLHYAAPSRYIQFSCTDELNGGLHQVCTYM